MTQVKLKTELCTWMFCLLMVGFVASYGYAESPQQAPKEVTKAAPDKGAAPSIQFAELSHDFGKAAQNASLKYAFTFKNAGTGTLIIENVKAS
jgi:hypothetical protein